MLLLLSAIYIVWFFVTFNNLFSLCARSLKSIDQVEQYENYLIYNYQLISKNSYWKNAQTWISSLLSKFPKTKISMNFYHLYLQYDLIFLHGRNPWVNLDHSIIFVFHFRFQKCGKIRFMKKTQDFQNSGLTACKLGFYVLSW